MKKILLLVIILSSSILLAGCLEFKKISYTDEKGLAINLNKAKEEKKTKEPGFKFGLGNISYTQGSNFNINMYKDKEKNEEKILFKSIDEFDWYVQDIKKQSDFIIKIIDTPGYTKNHLREIIRINDSLLQKMKNIAIPTEIIKTEEGRYYANKYANEELKTIIEFRTELVQCVEKSMKKTTKRLNDRIVLLKEGTIPTRENAFNFSRQSMMKEEGYTWDKKLKKYILKK